VSRRFPAAPGVAHRHHVGDQHVVVDLGVTGPGGGMAGGRPRQTARLGAHTGPSPPAARLPDQTIEVAQGGVTLRVGYLVHVLGPADHPQLGHRLVRRHHQIQARTPTRHQPGTGTRVVGAGRSEHRPPVGQVDVTGQAEQPGAGATPHHRCLTSGRVVVQRGGHRVVTAPGDAVFVVGDRVDTHHPHPRHQPCHLPALAPRSGRGSGRNRNGCNRVRRSLVVIRACVRLVKENIVAGNWRLLKVIFG
jgi:hypothetical protein